MRAMTDKELLKLGAGIIGLDMMFNQGKFSKMLAEMILEKSQKVKIVYVPVTEKDLVDLSFGC
jgi:hypothetical protein